MSVTEFICLAFIMRDRELIKKSFCGKQRSVRRTNNQNKQSNFNFYNNLFAFRIVLFAKKCATIYYLVVF